MNIVILNGAQSSEKTALEHTVDHLAEEISKRNHLITKFNLKSLNIKQCIGCFACWVKTPGVCIHKDDMVAIYKAIVKSDLLIFATPLIMGFVSSLTKKVGERILPLDLPFLKLANGESHHALRYPTSPILGLLLEPEDDTDDEDIKLVTDVYKRTAINFHTTLKFVHLTSDSIEEVINAIINT